MQKKVIAIAVAGALSLLATTAAVGAGSGSAMSGVMGYSVSADPMLAVEHNRSAIVERLAVSYRTALAAHGIDESAFRSALAALRADQLLAAALVGTLQEVSAIVAAPPTDYGMTRYTAVAPTSSLAAMPAADAYLVRSGESLAVVRASELQLTADTQLVGYFAAGSTGGIDSSGSSRLTPKDGSGSGAGSWIGYVAGGNVASGTGSAVAAGTGNTASAQGAFVGAGTANVASGVSSLVIGGFDNQATSTDALVGAGAGHRATGARSVIVGGGYNVASGNWSFVGGGGRDGIVNTPAGTSLLDNIASGNFSVVTGGQGNRAAGAFATVPGGNANLASGSTSFAAGNRAKTQTAGGSPVIHNGTFAFADGSAFDFYTTAANEFAVRATGGMRIVTAIDGTGLPTKSMTLTAAGTLTVPGILNLPSNGGYVTKSGTRFLHNTNFPADNSTFLGLNAGNFTSTAGNNTGLGALTLVANTGGFANTAVGANAMEQNTSGLGNSAMGAFALNLNATGNYNLAIGGSALFSNTTGTSNSAGGNAALASNVSGNENTAFGKSASQFNTTGSFNVALGHNTLRNTTSGCSNTAIGTGAFFGNETGCNNTGLGFNVTLANINLTNATAIGSNAFVDASNHVRIGDANVTQIGGQVAWTNLSDRREKKDVRELSLGLDFIKSLRPVEYKMRNGNDRIDFGFIAQEVETLLGTNYNVLGVGATAERKLSLRYTDLIAPMVKAIQQQQTSIELQQALIANQQTLIASQQAQLQMRDLEFAELRRSVEVLMARSSSLEKIATVR